MATLAVRIPARQIGRPPLTLINEFYEKGCQEKSSAFHRPGKNASSVRQKETRRKGGVVSK
jgi:hypothetical protein